MNWDIFQGNWKQMEGKVRQQWGNLTDGDMSKVRGKREELEGVLQTRYGYSKEQVKKELDAWSAKL